MAKLDVHACATIVNVALVATAGALCWRFKSLTPALILIFMRTSSTSNVAKKEEK